MVCSYQSRLFAALDILRLHKYVKYVYVSDKRSKYRKTVDIHYWPHNHSWEITLSMYNPNRRKNDLAQKQVNSRTAVYEILKRFIPANSADITIQMQEDWAFEQSLKNKHPLDNVPGLYSLSWG